MSGGAVSYRSQHDVRKALRDAAGETGYSLDDEQPMLLAWLCEGNLLDLLSALNAATGTRHFADPSDDRDLWYAYTSRNRQWKVQGAADASLDAASANVTGADSWTYTADALVNRQRATVDEPSPPDWPTKVWEYDLLPPLPRVVKLGSPLAIRPAFADYVIDGPTISAVFGAGDHAVLDYQHHGQTGDLTITADGADATLTALSITGYIVDRAPSATYSADDTASQALPRGVREAPEVGGDLAGPLVTAQGLADHVVWRFAGMPTRGGVLRPTATVVNWLPHAFRWDLYDTLALTIAQLNTSARVFEVVGLSEVWTVAASAAQVSVTTAYQLQERRVQPGDGSPTFFTLGTSVLDGADVLAY